MGKLDKIKNFGEFLTDDNGVQFNWYKAITNTLNDDSEDSFILVANSLSNAYINAKNIISKSKNGRHLVKVIHAPHLDKYWKEKH